MDKCKLNSKDCCFDQELERRDEKNFSGGNGYGLISERTADNSTKATAGSEPSDKKLQVLCCRGLRPASSAIDRDLWQWYCETSANHHGIGTKVSKRMVQARAKWAFHRAGITDFKASDGWYRRWISRWRRFGQNDDSKTDRPSSFIGENVERVAADKDERRAFNAASDKIRGEPETALLNKTAKSIKENNSSIPVNEKDCRTTCPDPSLSGTPSKRKFVSDDETQVKCSKVNCERITSSDSKGHNSANGQSSDSSDKTNATTMLSTPMLNIVDYLPPEIMHNLQNDIPQNLSYDNINGSTNSDTTNNVFPTSDVETSMDCLYYPASCELSLQNHVLSDCENDTLSNISNFPFELQQTDSYSCAIPTTAEADRMKDIMGFISSQQNNSPNSLRGLTFSNIDGNENVMSACSSQDSENFVNSIFRDVSIDINRQQENYKDGCTKNVPSEAMTSTVSQDVLAPEVILESHASFTEHGVSSKSKVKDSSSKKSKKSSSSLIKQRKKGERYLPQFKVKVLAYAATHTLRETAKKFKVNDGTISSWKKEKDWKQQLAQNAISSTSQGDTKKKVEAPLVDQQFLTWLRRCREQGCELTAAVLKDKARQMAGQGSMDNCHWFKLWVSRFDEEYVYQEGLEKMKRKQERHIQYPLAFKVEVAAFAEHHSQIVAARTFNVSRKRVFEWLQVHRSDHAIGTEPSEGSTDRAAEVEDETSKKLVSRRSNVDKEVDQQIWVWYQAQQTKGSKPSWHEVQAKGLELYRGKGNEGIKCSYRWYKRWCDRFHVVLRHEGDDAMLEWALTQLELGHSLTHNDLQVHALSLASDNAFKASPGWAIRFCKRHPELLQQSPTLDTALPGPLLQKVENFRIEVQKTVNDGKLTLASVGNMDELHLNFSALVSGSSNNAKRQLLVRRSEMENCHATIVLACLADGNILPPAVILKVSGLENEVDLPDGSVMVLQQEEGVMDAACMRQWLEHIWFKHVPAPNLLLLDCHEPHTSDSIVAEFSGRKSSRFIIPGGCTSKLQPLDVTLKSTFHTSIQKQWSVFNSHSSGTWDGNKLHLPSRKEIVDWVTVTYQNLQATDQETVRRSFLVTGLTVAANRSEDHFIENLSMIPQAKNSTA